MSRLITFSGTPNSGKTTISLKFAKKLYDRTKCSVIIVFCDIDTPALPVILPNRKADELASLGGVLSKAEVLAEDITESVVTFKKYPNFGMFGYLLGENRFTYPEYDRRKSLDFIHEVSKLAEYVVFDCVKDNLLSDTAIESADTRFFVVAPDMKSIANYASLNRTGDSSEILCINCPESIVSPPFDEVSTFFHDAKYTVPFCRCVRQQFYDGSLLSDSYCKNFESAISSLTGEVI